MSRIIGVLVAALVAGVFATGSPSAVADAGRPNFVVVTADDMRLDDIQWMPHTRELLGQFTANQFLSHHPLCCPARAEILTGQFAENNGVFHNGGPFGADRALRDRDNTVASWLFDAGYKTGFVGKWLNGWHPIHEGAQQPYGWTNFNAWIGQTSATPIYTAYEYWDWNNGDYYQPKLHTNDGVTAETVSQIKEYGQDPFFLWASYVAPHGMKDPDTNRYIKGGPVPAPRHRTMFAKTIPPYQSKPSFTYGSTRTQDYRTMWRNRIRSLQSVDEGVRDIVNTLSATGELDNTVVVFLSDNGFLLGEHRAHGKNTPWEEALQVPFLARGPGVATGTTSKAAMIPDLAPSIAALAGVTPGRAVDGRSDLFSLGGGWDEVVIQAGTNNGRHHFKWRGLRTPKWTYVHWIDGRKELYNRARDPYQLRNLAGKRPAIQSQLAARTPLPY